MSNESTCTLVLFSVKFTAAQLLTVHIITVYVYLIVFMQDNYSKLICPLVAPPKPHRKNNVFNAELDDLLLVTGKALHPNFVRDIQFGFFIHNSSMHAVTSYLPTYSNYHSLFWHLPSDDCGVFVLAIADHLARCHVLRFTQEDMWYFCQKIVHNIYHRQLDRSAGHEASPSSSVAWDVLPMPS